MSCHRIGLGMNSVVEKSIEMFENEEISLNACKKIIVACRNGVYWCDGNLLPVLLIVIVAIV